MNSGEAETRAREYVKKKHSRVERIFFKTMYPEGDTWALDGEVEFKRAYFFSTMRSVKLRVNMNTGDITSCVEAYMPKPKAR